MAQKKMGRPVGEGGRKSNNVKIRLDDNMNNSLIEYCKKNNITKAEAIRLGIHLLLEKKIK